ncbi:TolC family protein [Cerasicoccus fimbriatus]|uniref:TolC family protein n=1 Tax=Cerasicoccus fimbriatus TaxID=3014554 RepID=UPI0022B39BDD|nr:TolC family protein [Cerasicoccus sp. TK19100]
MSLKNWFHALLRLVCLGLLSSTVSYAQSPDVTVEEAPPTLTIAIVRDGPSYILDAMIEAVKKETTALLKSKHTVVFREDADFNANWFPGGARLALKRALDDPSIDMVILQGYFSLEEAASGALTLNKPCIGAYVQDPKIVAPFIKNGRSQIENLSVIVSDISLQDDVKKFHDLVGFDKVLYAVTDAYLNDVKEDGQIAALLNKMDTDLGITHGFIPLSATAADSLRATPDRAEAVFFFPPLRFPSEDQLEDYITGINARAIPTFAMTGESGVAEGFLFGTMPDLRTQLARRAALNIKELLEGRTSTQIDALFRVEKKLYVNIVTASGINFDLPTDMLFDAVLIGGEAPQINAVPLTLVQAVELAIKANYELRARREDTEAVYEAQRQALSQMLPQVNAVYQYTRNNDAAARDSLGTIPRQSNSVGIGVSQMVYDDDIVTGYRISEQESYVAQYQEQSLESDVIQVSSVAYLRYLTAKSILAIAKENLDVTRTNLGLARVRLDVGTSGPEEVYRFEAAEASDRATVALAESQVQTALTSLNRVMGQDDLATTWDAEQIGLSSDAFDTTSRRVVELLTSEARSQRFRLFSMQYAMSHAPELEVADRRVTAQELSLGAAKRSFLVPDVGVNFNYLNTFQQDTYESLPGSANTPKDEWQFVFQASIPIFEGGNRVFNVLRQKALVRGREYDRSLTRQIIEERVLVSLYSLSSSYSDIRFSRIAADRAQKNLDIVTEKYRVGRVSIVDLLDAQNQAFVQKQNEVLSTYGFLEDLVDYMRAINWFEFLSTPEQQDMWLNSVKSFIEPSRPRTTTTVAPQ